VQLTEVVNASQSEQLHTVLYVNWCSNL